MIRVAVVAAAMALRAGLRAMLSAGEDVEVVSEAANPGELLPLPAGIDVIVAVVEEASLPGLREAAAGLEPAALLFLLSDETGAARVLSGLRRNIWGFLPLEASADELLAALRAVHEGLLVGAPALVEPLVARPARVGSSGVEPLLEALAGPLAGQQVEPLTGREVEVLQLLAQGLSNKQIAASLHISEHTVKFHVSAIYSKFGAANRTEAVRHGVRQGLIIL